MTGRAPVLLVANSDWYLYNFRRALMERLRSEGRRVLLASPSGPYADRLRELGFEWRRFDLEARSVNPLRELGAFVGMLHLFRREKPALIHLYTIKCVLYGCIAARLCGAIPVVASVTGLGHVFAGGGLLKAPLRWVVRLLYRVAFGHARLRVVFQNEEDRGRFVASGMVDAPRAELIRGSGVDAARFRPADGESGEGGDGGDGGARRKRGPIRVLFASRMLKEKGVLDLLDAASILEGEGVDLEFLFAGARLPGRDGALPPEYLARLGEQRGVTYIGHSDDMVALLRDADIVALPTYYGEGTPRILIEAASMGKPLVATDIAGCRGIVQDGVSGLLVEPRDPAALADAIRALAVDVELRERFGREGRRIVLEQFEDRVVLSKTLAVYASLEEAAPA